MDHEGSTKVGCREVYGRPAAQTSSKRSIGKLNLK
jgi:hypothetical protein